jgi:hypothetical protein
MHATCFVLMMKLLRGVIIRQLQWCDSNSSLVKPMLIIVQNITSQISTNSRGVSRYNSLLPYRSAIN